MVDIESILDIDIVCEGGQNDCIRPQLHFQLCTVCRPWGWMEM